MIGKTYSNIGNTDELLDKISLSSDVSSALDVIFRVFGLKHYVFHLGTLQIADFEKPYIRTNYPPEWVSHYLMNDYINIDPVAKEGFRRLIPFDWRELTLDAEAMVVMQQAQKHDLGCQGYSIPVIDRDARRSLFSLTSDLDDGEWDAFISENREMLAEAAMAIHRRALTEVLGEAGDMPTLGPRELECLTWTARGKDYLDIAEILGISGHTVRGYLKSARFKLECVTLPQAVARAQKLGLIKV